MKKVIVILFSTLITSFSYGQSEEKEFDIQQLEWLVGRWTGNGFGGVSEEIWAPAVDGTMMGMYRHVKEGKVVFYEFLHITKDGMRLKHFNSDLTAWEDKTGMVNFEYVSSDENSIQFKGLKIERTGANTMDISLKLKQNGEVHTEVFNFTKE